MRQDYPKWLYNKGGSTLVKSVEEHEALGSGWYESPALIPTDEPVAISKPHLSRSELIVMAAELGVKVDNRWSDARLTQEIEAA